MLISLLRFHRFSSEYNFYLFVSVKSNNNQQIRPQNVSLLFNIKRTREKILFKIFINNIRMVSAQNKIFVGWNLIHGSCWRLKDILSILNHAYPVVWRFTRAIFCSSLMPNVIIVVRFNSLQALLEPFVLVRRMIGDEIHEQQQIFIVRSS